MTTEKDELKEKMKDMGFVEKVMKPLMNEYYMEQGKNTKGELIVMVAKQDIEIEKLKADCSRFIDTINELREENEKLKERNKLFHKQLTYEYQEGYRAGKYDEKLHSYNKALEDVEKKADYSEYCRYCKKESNVFKLIQELKKEIKE